AADRIAIHVNVEDVHEDRESPRLAVNEGRLIDLCDEDQLAVGGRYDDAAAALTGTLGVAKKRRDPDRHEHQCEAEYPERPGAAGDRDEHHRDGDERRGNDESQTFTGEVHASSEMFNSAPVIRRKASR